MPEVPMDPIEAEAEAPEAGEVVVPPRSASRVEDGAGSDRAILLDLERERKVRQKLERDFKKLQEQNQTEAEKALEAARAEGRAEANTVANTRLLRAELKAAASGVLQDPDDAVRLLDLDEFEVGDDGDIDTKALRAAVERLAATKPYLVVGAKPAPLPGGGATPSQGSSMDDALRAAISGGGGRL